jgi:hypothetical protein
MNLNQKLTEAIDKLIPEAKLKHPHCLDGGFEVYHDINCNPIPGSKDCTTGEPELRHVMWALKAAKHFYIYVNTEGEFVDESPLNGYPETLGFYDLTKSLYKQTEELRQWLLNLLTE